MNLFRKILVPIDGTALSDTAFTQTLSYAKVVHGKITVIHVMENNIHLPPPFDTTKVTPAMHLMETERRGIAKSIISDYIKRSKKEKVKIDTLIIKGNMVGEIIKKSAKFDLIIMGSLGESLLKSLFLGYNTEKVTQHASCSVMLVKEKKSRLSGPGIGTYEEVERILPSNYVSLLDVNDTEKTIYV